MGASIAGFFKSNKNVETKNLTPQEKQLNQYRVNQFANTDQLSPDFYQGMNNIYQYGNQPDPGVAYYYGLATGEAFNKPAFGREDWYNQSNQGLDFRPFSQGTDQRFDSINQANSDNFQGINQINNQNFQNIDTQLSGLGDDLFRTGNSYYDNIVGPQIGSEYSLMGLGRSGGRQEAEAKGAASIALPIQQQIAGFRNNAMLTGAQYQNQANMTNAAYQNQANMVNAGYQNQFQNQYLNNRFNLNMAQPGVDTQTRDAQLQRMIAGAPLTDYARTTRLQGNIDFSNLWLSALNATPFTQGTGTTNKGTQWGVSGQAQAQVPGFG